MRRLAPALGLAALALLAFALAPSLMRAEEEPPPRAAAPTSASDASDASDAPARAAGAPDARTVILDLGAQIAEAERYRGETLVADLGVASGAKYTLGGFHTGLAPADVLGRSVVVGSGRSARLRFPVRHPGTRTLTLITRTFARGALRIYLDDAEVRPESEDAGDGFRRHRITLREELSLGEHAFLLRPPRAAAMPGGGRGRVAIDGFCVGDDPCQNVQGPETLVGDAGAALTLVIPEGESLLFGLRLAEGRALSGVSAGEGTLEVSVEADGLARTSRPLRGRPARASIAAAGAPLGLLRIGARGGEAQLTAPAITAPRPSAAAAPSPVRNVLLYLIDTLRTDRLTPYASGTRVQTPNLVRFASGATVFESAHAAENWTKPSVATLLSGLMPWQHTATQGESVVPRSVALLPERLRDAGFHTGAFITNGYVSDRFGFGRGWASYRNYLREGRRTEAEHVAADALSWLDRRPADRPFFLYVHTIDPHVPYRPPAEDLARYGDPDYRGRVSFRRDALLLEHIKSGRLRLNDADQRQLEALYDGEITYHDRHFGALLRGLEARGLADSTLVIITSDHGEEFWDHGSVGHGHSVWEELLHVPLVVRHPGVAGGAARVGTEASLADVAPTIFASLGLDIPEAFSGRSLLPALRRAETGGLEATTSGFMENWRVVHLEGMKLIQRPGHRQRLFDLREDAAEENDLAETRPLTVGILRGRLGMELRRTENGGTRGSMRRHRPRRTEIDAETAAQLRALGYIE